MNSESTGCGCLIIVLVIPFIFSCIAHLGMTFCMPTAKNYMETCYREKAFNEAQKMALAQDKAYWERMGYSTERDLKSYESYIVEFKDESDDEALDKRCRYVGQGTYQVLVVILTHLGDGRNKKYEPTAKFYHSYLVQISSHPKRRIYGTVDLGWTQESVEMVSSQQDAGKLQSKLETVLKQRSGKQ